ncbi:MAG: hypothetical protein M3347_01705 [Armatimonadota bacterium]|nr:hypothetical protein [Armatimonadota bacterium]
MGVELLVTSSLAAAAVKVVKELVDQVKSSKETQKSIRVEINGKIIDLPLGAGGNQELIDVLKAIELTPQANDGPLTLSKKATEEPKPTDIIQAESASSAEIGGAALAISSDSVFRDARRRINLVFMFNLGLSIVLAVILLAGVAGAVASAVFLKQNTWAAIFGGVSAADLLGLYIFKPLVAVNSAIVAAQRMDLLHLRMYEQLKTCQGHEVLAERIACQTVVWKEIQEELSKLAGAGSVP